MSLTDSQIQKLPQSKEEILEDLQSFLEMISPIIDQVQKNAGRSEMMIAAAVFKNLPKMNKSGGFKNLMPLFEKYKALVIVD